MQLLERVKKAGFLGREFLAWLWFRSETNGGRFDFGEEKTLDLWFDKKIVLESEEEEGVEKVVCTGDHPHLKEARYALKENKEITEAGIRLVIGDNEWSFVLDSTWLNFKNFKTPKTMADKGEDPDGLFYEKFFLVEQAVSAIDTLFAAFVKLRTSP
ncbi:MAG: hypothetical protein JRJ01_12660, partial [Deltaproteobacteria bacterium]|nr:hypothetical protein [Deltaproteobacteria bacterium]